jgi:hypothetical protein
MRGHLTLLMLLCGTPAAWAQTATVAFVKQIEPMTFQVRFPPQVEESPTTSAKPDEMVARVMSFDRDGDGKVARVELAERMEGLIEQADASGDGALDEAEVRKMAERPPAQTVFRGFQVGHYGFIDETGQSSRARVQGVLADLKLPDSTFRDASAVVTKFVNELGVRVTTELLDTMRSIVPAEEFARLQGVVIPNVPITVFATGRTSSGVVLLVNGGQRTIPLSMAEAERDLGVAAIERFNKRQRMTEEIDRIALVEQMQGILTVEQADDFRAALVRRPIAKAGQTVSIGNVQQMALNPDAMQRVITTFPAVSVPAIER